MNPLPAFFLFVVVPHITDAIQDWVTRVSGEPVEKDTNADVCIIEVSEQEKSIIFSHLGHFHSPARVKSIPAFIKGWSRLIEKISQGLDNVEIKYFNGNN